MKNSKMLRKEKIPKEIRGRLILEYLDDIQKLEGLIGKDLNAWKQ